MQPPLNKNATYQINHIRKIKYGLHTNEGLLRLNSIKLK